MPFAISIAFFTIGMVFAGRWQDRVGPRTVAVTGGVLVGVGFILSGFIGSSLGGLYLSFGVIAGLGIGTAYVAPLAVTIRWWPDKRGPMTALVVLAFSAGAVIVGVGGPLLIQGTGLSTTFIIFGILFGAVITFCGTMLRNPPPGYKPAGWSPPPPAPGPKVVMFDSSPGEMLRTTAFWLIWIMYAISAGIGLAIISQASPIGQELAGLSPVSAGGALTMLTVFNGLGRPGFGWISNAIGRRNAMALVFAFHITALLLVLPNASGFFVYALGVCMVGFAFGGTLALMPAFVADFFGTKNLGINYGWLFSAYGVAGLVATLYAIHVRELTDNWTIAFFYLATASALGLVLSFVATPPAPKGVEVRV